MAHERKRDEDTKTFVKEELNDAALRYPHGSEILFMYQQFLSTVEGGYNREAVVEELNLRMEVDLASVKVGEDGKPVQPDS